MRFTKYPPRTFRAVRSSASTWKPGRLDQKSDAYAFPAREVRVFVARRTPDSFTWVEVDVPELLGDGDFPVLLVARRP